MSGGDEGGTRRLGKTAPYAVRREPEAVWGRDRANVRSSDVLLAEVPVGSLRTCDKISVDREHLRRWVPPCPLQVVTHGYGGTFRMLEKSTQSDAPGGSGRHGGGTTRDQGRGGLGAAGLRGGALCSSSVSRRAD